VLDILSGLRLEDGAGYLDPSAARFAYIDFDTSVVLPMDTDIDGVLMEREMRIGVITLRLPECEANPFEDDVVVLLAMLQRYTRVSRTFRCRSTCSDSLFGRRFWRQKFLRLGCSSTNTWQT
jgi:hypothetical protein